MINLKEGEECEVCLGLEDISWRLKNLLACAQKEENFIEDSKLTIIDRRHHLKP